MSIGNWSSKVQKADASQAGPMRLPPSLFASLAKVANSHLPPSTTSTPVISALVYFVFRSFPEMSKSTRFGKIACVIIWQTFIHQTQEWFYVQHISKYLHMSPDMLDQLKCEIALLLLLLLTLQSQKHLEFKRCNKTRQDINDFIEAIF